MTLILFYLLPPAVEDLTRNQQRHQVLSKRNVLSHLVVVQIKEKLFFALVFSNLILFLMGTESLALYNLPNEQFSQIELPFCLTNVK